MRKIGITFIILGIAIFISYFIYNMTLAKKLQKNINDYINETSVVIEEEHEDIPEDIIIKEEKKKTTNINYTAILEIPVINLKSGIVDNTKNFNSINYAISADRNGNYPNENGNFILYSHSGNSSISFFHNLYKVNVNDLVYVYYNGIKYEYKIFKKYDIPKKGKAKVISSKKDKYITLITCNQSRKGYQIVLIGKINNYTQYQKIKGDD